jgi:hypothetical protein
MRERERKKKPLHSLRLQPYVDTVLPAGGGVAQTHNYQDQFDFRGFLGGRLVRLPPRAKPTFMTAEEKRRLKDVCLLSISTH